LQEGVGRAEQRRYRETEPDPGGRLSSRIGAVEPEERRQRARRRLRRAERGVHLGEELVDRQDPVVSEQRPLLLDQDQERDGVDERQQAQQHEAGECVG
jgi:hypothetical protein